MTKFDCFMLGCFVGGIIGILVLSYVNGTLF